MKVVVDPKMPIPGILEKNKFLVEKMELDLNEKEIYRCMQFGTVYNENGDVIDLEYLNSISKHKFRKPYSKPEITIKSRPFGNNRHSEPETPTVMSLRPTEEEQGELSIVEVSCTKEEDYIILELGAETGSVSGDLFGLLSVFTNVKPMVEYKVKDRWVKFNGKFSNLSKVKAGDFFVFRIHPKNDSNMKYTFRLKDKENNNELFKLEGTINTENL
jgi:hypothetical protein